MDVFTFLDPYLFMQKYYHFRKNNEFGFSYTSWAQELGLSSGSALRMMVNGKKKITRGVARRFMEKHLTENDQKKYFSLLVSHAHAPTTEDKNSTWSAISQVLANRITQEDELNYFTYVSDLIIPKIWTILSFEDTEWTAQKLSEVLDADISTVEIALAKLEEIGLALCYRGNSSLFTWQAKAALVRVNNKASAVALSAYHNASLEEAKQAQKLPKETCRYKSFLITLSEEDFRNVTEEVEKFTMQLIANYQPIHLQGRKVYKFNLNYYPVTKDIGSSSKNKK